MEQEPQSSEQQPTRFSNETLAVIFSQTSEGFEEQADPQDNPESARNLRDLFTFAFNFGVDQLDLSEADAARIMKTSKSGIRRWSAGQSAPHPRVRASVFYEFLSEANRRIEQESAD
jgi:hypothetical protein